MSTDNNTQSLPEVCDELGLSIEHSTPRYFSRKEAESAGHGRWQHVRCIVTVKRHGKAVWTGPFHQGLACVEFADRGLQQDHERGLMVLMHEELLNRMPTLFVKWHKPELSDVMHSLLSDGSPDLDAETFEEWCDNLGMDTDSRKAEAQYRECINTGRALRRAFNFKELDRLQEAATDY